MLWALLPVVVLIAGLAPAAISFAAGQAAFTLTLLILFNLLAPAGLEDRAGADRGRRARRRRQPARRPAVLAARRRPPRSGGRWRAPTATAPATSPARSPTASDCCDASGPQAAPPQPAGAGTPRPPRAARRHLPRLPRRARLQAGAARRGHELVTGVAGVRLAGDAVLDLWDGGDGERAAIARPRAASCSTAAGSMTEWYDALRGEPCRRRRGARPARARRGADGRLVDAVAHDLRDARRPRHRDRRARDLDRRPPRRGAPAAGDLVEPARAVVT